MKGMLLTLALAAIIAAAGVAYAQNAKTGPTAAGIAAWCLSAMGGATVHHGMMMPGSAQHDRAPWGPGMMYDGARGCTL